MISLAVCESIVLLHINTPPKAETGSDFNAFFHESIMFSLEAIPQALLCFNIANVGSSNSHINWTAELMSSKLLYEISFPLSFRKVSSRLPKKTAFW